MKKQEIKEPYINLLPPLSKEEYEALKSNIETEGIREPIVIDEDSNILDGHHRYKICPSAPTKTIKGLSEAEKKAYVYQVNLTRRNLSPEQKREIRKSMQKIAKLLREENPKKHTQEAIAARLGVSQQVIAYWLKEGNNTKISNTSARPDARVKVPPKQRPKLAEEIEKGEPIKQVAADYGITERHVRNIVTKEQKAKEAKKKVADSIKKQSGKATKILFGDFRKVGDVIPDESVDLIITDPPYDKDSVNLYGDLAILASRILKPGGWCLAYAGHSFLPNIYSSMNGLLEYGWTFAIIHKGGAPRFRKYKIQVSWKPVVGFYKSPMNVWWDWFADITSGGKEKEDHKWQQALSEAEYFIRNFTIEDAVVLDPMCGSGTVCLAAKNLNRQWIGIELDKESRDVALSKLL